MPKRRPLKKKSVSSEPGPAPSKAKDDKFTVVAVGASAGGIEALSELLTYLPADTGLALVVIQHLDPKHESMLADLLSKHTEMPVTEVRDGMRVERNHVYVISPNTSMSIVNGTLQLGPREQ